MTGNDVWLVLGCMSGLAAVAVGIVWLVGYLQDRSHARHVGMKFSLFLLDLEQRRVQDSTHDQPKERPLWR